MDVICRALRRGKTTEVIKRCAAQGGYIVCANMLEVNRVSRMTRELNLAIPYPITFYDFIEGRYLSNGVKCFHIDNIDICLAGISKVPINTISITTKDAGE